jgi:ribosomal protein S18 acetylase RimI-like enzyme
VNATSYSEVGAFLAAAALALEAHEAANSLMLGLCGQIARHPAWVRSQPFLMTVGEGSDLAISAVMTPPHKLIAVGHRRDLDAAAELLVGWLSEGRWNVPGVLGPAEAASAVANAWSRSGKGRAELARRQRVYELREVQVPRPERGQLRLAGIQDLDLISRWRYQFTMGILGTANRRHSDRIALERVENRDVYLWEDERPVSTAMKTRPTRHGITVSYVYTPPGSRGCGYATACVSQLSRVLLDAGWGFCSLFADVDNAVAVHVYRKIGYRPVCDYHEYQFVGSPAPQP